MFAKNGAIDEIFTLHVFPNYIKGVYADEKKHATDLRAFLEAKKREATQHKEKYIRILGEDKYDALKINGKTLLQIIDDDLSDLLKPKDNNVKEATASQVGLYSENSKLYDISLKSDDEVPTQKKHDRRSSCCIIL